MFPKIVLLKNVPLDPGSQVFSRSVWRLLLYWPGSTIAAFLCLFVDDDILVRCANIAGIKKDKPKIIISQLETWLASQMFYKNCSLIGHKTVVPSTCWTLVSLHFGSTKMFLAWNEIQKNMQHINMVKSIVFKCLTKNLNQLFMLFIYNVKCSIFMQ